MTDRTTLAELYVLGLLDDSKAAEVDARLADPRVSEDRGLAIEVGATRDRFLPLDLTAPEAPLSEGAWERLEAALHRGHCLPDEDRRTRGQPHRRAGFWRPVALAAGAAAVVLGALLAWRMLVVEVPAAVAVLLDDEGRAVAVVEAFDDDSVRVLPLQPAAADGRVFQLWTKPDPDGPPVSVGVLEALQTMRLEGPDLPDPEQGQLYEITIEPPGGSPTGGPTGRIVGKGLAREPL